MNIVIKIILAGALGLASLAADAQEYKAGKLSIDNVWVRLTIPGRPGAGYMKVRNMGEQADRILSATSSMAKRVELHTTLMKDGIMKMRPAGQVEIPASGQIELKPGGLHFMIFGLNSQIRPGDKLPLTLVFERAGRIELAAPVEALGKKKMH